MGEEEGSDAQSDEPEESGLEPHLVCRGQAQEAEGAHAQEPEYPGQLEEVEAVPQGQAKGVEGEEGELLALERKIEMAALWALEHKMSIIYAQRQRSAAHCALFLRGLDRDHRSQPRHRGGSAGSPGAHQQRGEGPQCQFQTWGHEREGRKIRGGKAPQRTLSEGIPRSPYYDSPGLPERAPRIGHSKIGRSRLRGPSSAGQLQLNVHV